MPVLQTTGIVVPPHFPALSYDATNVHVMGKGFGPPLTPLWACAWNAVGYRFALAHESAAALDASIAVHGDMPPPPQRAVQEHALFTLYGSALSALECAAFGAFVLGAMAGAANFPLATPAHLRAVTPARAAQAFAVAFPSNALTTALANLVADPSLGAISANRNSLSHRGAPGRSTNVSLGSVAAPNSTTWNLDGTSIVPGMGAQREQALAALLTPIVTDIHVFALAHV